MRTLVIIIVGIVAWIVLLAMAGCATRAILPHEGAVIDGPWPQAVEQCKAQPDLDWCRHVVK